mmetsp:Transcript_2386/g.4407  ORF Transcript_2386/g.4407 Transcript_2386/m.4407 type:complete len:309 (+) Transcript_2386:107-1033(+)|eukprot:CAMPEP_0178746056 /NCGR_PEP_ID=MMETSP0744-20121128/7614_1 /TAXON_ID=913974 /ORGANISM="Nitzschia punctata, Strain CCMP561" /LENGTH=308 /DNA_ID=CAMNT_0020399259 /DNA_START=151 /DNA_END=1077 /DNA_ORIENTATION=+
MMNAATEQTLETIQAMRRQEESSYGVSDYLSQLPQMTHQPQNPLDTPVDASCRFVMAKWCNEIADFCNYKRETVAIALNCLDRFMSTPSGQQILMDRNLYQLSAMTALYSSVKIHEQEAMDPNLVSSLSRGVHTAEAVEAMEARMLFAIQFRVNPPTAMSFVRSMMDLVPDHIVGPCERETIMEVTRFQVEMAVNEYEFCGVQPSSVAFACLLNAIESLSEDGMFYANFESTMANAVGIVVRDLRDLRIALYQLMNGNDTMCLQEPVPTAADNTATTSHASKFMEGTCGEPFSAEGSYFNTSPRSVNA